MGWEAQVVEKKIPYTFRSLDLFGIIDIVVLDGRGGGPLGVQVTAGSAHAARRTKALAEPRLATWLSSPARFEIWSYSKRGDAGKRKLWALRIEEITQDQLEDGHERDV